MIDGPADSRIIPIDQFYKGPSQVDLQPWEILREIRIPRDNYQDCYGYYYKYALRNALDIAVLGAAVLIRLSPDQRGSPLVWLVPHPCAPAKRSRP